MLPLLLVFFTIYGLMHLYLLLKVRQAFPHLGRWTLLVAAILLLLVVAPPLTQLLDRPRYLKLSHPLGRAAFFWMAAIFWFVVLALAVDLWSLLVRLVALAAPAARAALPSPRLTFLASAALIALGLAWGLYEASHLRLTRLTVEVPYLPPGRQTVTIAQFSDLHLGMHTGWYRTSRLLALLRDLRPDILVSTGDLVDASPEAVAPFAPPLRELPAPLGKFAVLGNHEYYQGLDASLAFHEAAGFRLLRQESVTIGPGLVIVGVDDPAGVHRNQDCRLDEDAVLPSGTEPVTAIFLKHQPVIGAVSPGRFNLQLSGHTHGGQIFPFQMVTRMTYKFYHGLYRLPRGSQLYTNVGAGTWGPPIRLLVPPEVTLITLKLAPTGDLPGRQPWPRETLPPPPADTADTPSLDPLRNPPAE